MGPAGGADRQSSFVLFLDHSGSELRGSELRDGSERGGCHSDRERESYPGAGKETDVYMK
jgi:hypothetical protein